jgi:hypothetical protein
MISKLIHLWIGLALLAGGLGLGQPIRSRAQSGDPTPPAPVRPGRFPARPGQPDSGIQRTPNGLVYREQADSPLTPQQVNKGPDDFGYVINSVPIGWIDLTTFGTDTGLGKSKAITGAIPIPFPFKYYENTYNQLWISIFGYLTFTDPQGYAKTQGWMLMPTRPNNMIAPYWTPLDLPNLTHGYVLYGSGGIAPNRYLAIQWIGLQDTTMPNNYFSYEAVLMENNNILFQYDAMSTWGQYYCGDSGIENSAGIIGLNLQYYCAPLPTSHTAWAVLRPAAAARMTIDSQVQGAFYTLGQPARFQFQVKNVGDLGTDTFDLTTASTWPVRFYAADGSTPLMDTNANGKPDTGPLASNQTSTVVAIVQPPTFLQNVGDHSQAIATVASALDPTVTRTVQLDAAAPAPFAQGHQQATYPVPAYNVAARTVGPQPGMNNRVGLVASGDFLEPPAIAETANGNFVSVWVRSRCLGVNANERCIDQVDELYYAITSRNGAIIRSATRLTDHSAATYTIYNNSVGVAAAPNGRIGITWHQFQRNRTLNQFNLNVFFAILDAAGNVVAPPTNLTQVSTWWPWDIPAIGETWFRSSRIAASFDNRFLVVWQRQVKTAGGYPRDIYATLLNFDGALINSPAPLTAASDNSGFEEPFLVHQTNGAFILFYLGGNGLNYKRLDHNGATIQSGNNPDYYLSDCYPQAVELTNGRILIAWFPPKDSITFRRVVKYALLDGATFASLGAAVELDPGEPIQSVAVSVTADRAGNGILTWMDNHSAYASYYALVDSNGAVVTPPMSFEPAQPNNLTENMVHFDGYGNTSLTVDPSGPAADTYLTSAALVGAAPSGRAGVLLSYGNDGATAASSVTITATLPAGLTYLGDSISGVTPVVSVSTPAGTTLSWNLPGSLKFLGRGQFTLYLGVPDAPFGTRYPLSLHLKSDQPDGNPARTTANVEVMVGRQVFGPLILR